MKEMIGLFVSFQQEQYFLKNNQVQEVLTKYNISMNVKLQKRFLPK